MNRAAYEFIVASGFHKLEGLDAFYQKAAKDPSLRVSFPPASRQVKAEWEPAEEKDRSRYHTTITTNGKLQRLVALHIITKDLPNWFFATFVHKEKSAPSPRLPDLPRALKGTKWENYLLVGTQVDFTDSMGRPIRLANPVIEAGFQDSSCMSCHALATIGPNSTSLCSVDMLLPSCSGLGCLTGPPDFQVFTKDRVYFQLDFVWSFRNAAFRPGRPGCTDRPVSAK